ncbi:MULTISPECIES: DUF1338 domain-containing protein [unclassified Herbaspirillum]|uniref:DUF1338 domain-containing protein n=1 Tax=unclassified Herbaspirillum TaxID=2624150 RepID=UPI000E2ECE23|nr:MULTISPECIES: DUF1338 domain-containing protein [unclassified Herbaspirillum]RFB74060.1 DUF1338 domain-containing protein [Herbaspirillum sp. 3R-3a1]TFI10126.1 DUF1338 domain-containing protein [Herbaspirillum sp. 3R11]TFI16031.1 DUF1338 domain-containing protein [Herbaspirillum sp. 3R-11]TFI30463.1 DUF1338 domain-containing protein [Herbaspirillum sp. 3C11]
MTTPARDSNLHLLLTSAYQNDNAVQRLFDLLEVPASTLRPASISVTRLELAQALNMLLFDKLLQEVPAGRDYVADAAAAGTKICFDHGAVRTVLRGKAGSFPDGEALFTRMFLPLGYQLAGLYPLPRINMTGHVYSHIDDPENIAQFFVSELHPEKFSAEFQSTVDAVLASSRDPLSADLLALLGKLADDGALPITSAQRLLPAMLGCFARHHDLPTLPQYEALRAESAEMAWISTEGSVFNHATDRVANVVATAELQRQLGRPIKDEVEVSRNGRVRQTAFRAGKVSYQLKDAAGAPVDISVPGSFYEFISRDTYIDDAGVSKLDLTFDSGNAQGIFKMTGAAENATTGTGGNVR